MSAIITVKHLTKDYYLFNQHHQVIHMALGGNYKCYRALENINFEVNQGEVFAIIGANGAGKSTLLKIMAGVLSDYQGLVNVKGRISAILEMATSFNEEITGRQNIYRHLLLQGYLKQQIAKLESDIIEFSELEEVIDQQFKTYSMGMKAKLAFSVITSSVNDVLLIDELLVVGDEHFQGKSFQRIKEICLSGRTVVIVSHNLAYVERLCERTMWLDKGRIKKIGPSYEVCMAYYGQDAENVDENYPKEFGYIESVDVVTTEDKFIIKSRIMRIKSSPDLHFQIAIHDSSTGILSALMNTFWQKVNLPSGLGPIEIIAEIPAPQGLHYGIVGTVLIHGYGSASGSIIQDSWGWDNFKQIPFTVKKKDKSKAYVRVPMKWKSVHKSK